MSDSETNTEWGQNPWPDRITDVRISNRLELCGIRTLGEIAEKPDSFWLAIPGFGKKSLRIIHQAIADQPKPDLPERDFQKEGIPWNLLIDDFRTTTCLNRLGVETIGEIALKTDKELLAVKGLGKRCLKIIREAQVATIGEIKLGRSPFPEIVQLELLPPLDPDIFERLPEEEAWAKCAETASVSPEDLQILLRPDTLEEAGTRLGVTKERIRQRMMRAARNLTRNSQTRAALEGWFQQTELDLLERYRQEKRSNHVKKANTSRPLSNEEHGLLRLFAPNKTDWAKKHNVDVNTWLVNPTREEAKTLLATLPKNGVTTANQLSQFTGIPKKVIQTLNGYRDGYVSRTPLSKIDTELLRITDPWRDQILVSRKEIVAATPGIDVTAFDDLLQKSVFAWGAGPWVVIPPRTYARVPDTSTKQKTHNRNPSRIKKALKALQQQTMWRTSHALAVVKKECGIGTTYWINHLPEITRLAPGVMCAKQSLSNKEWEEIHEGLMTHKDVNTYILAKESNSQLADFPAWSPTLEYKWACWMKQLHDPKTEALEIHFSRVAKPQLWPISQEEKDIWKSQYQWTSQQDAPDYAERKGFNWELKDYANAAALALATGGVSVFDLGILKGRLPSRNTDVLDELTEEGWFEPRTGVDWRPTKPNRTNKNDLLAMIHVYCQERAITHNPRRKQ